MINQGSGPHKRVLVTFDEDQVKIIQSLKGFGTKDAEIVRSIVMAYLSEHNYIKQASIDRDRASGSQIERSRRRQMSQIENTNSLALAATAERQVLRGGLKPVILRLAGAMADDSV